jgi:hypothetical protein
VRVADDETGTSQLRMSEAGLEASTISNVKCYGAFHVTTLRFPRQIIKGGATSKYVEVYCRICGAWVVLWFDPALSGMPTVPLDSARRASWSPTWRVVRVAGRPRRNGFA